MKFEHIIVTRFNLGIYDRPDADEWMDRRVSLFEEYTLPSIIGQTNKRFTWVIGFDERTPPEILCRYDYIDNVKIIFEQPKKWLSETPPDDIRISTRIDSDDYAEPDWVDTIQKTAMSLYHIDKVPLPFVIDMVGRALDAQTGIYYDMHRRNYTSMFLSVVSANADAHCMAHDHSTMAGRYVTFWVKDYGWVMVCHGGNMLNSIKQHYTRLPDNLQGYYVNG